MIGLTARTILASAVLLAFLAASGLLQVPRP